MIELNKLNSSDTNNVKLKHAMLIVNSANFHLKKTLDFS